MKSLLPIILVILLLTGAITYVLSKNTLPKIVTKQEIVSPNELEADSFMTPTPTATPSPKATPTATATPTKAMETSKGAVDASKSVVNIVPTITVKKSLTEEPVTKGGIDEKDIKIVDSKTKKEVITKITKTTVCTPVYGAANTCVEHEVVDTGAEDVLFFNLAGASYLAGLLAFVKGKRA